MKSYLIGGVLIGVLVVVIVLFQSVRLNKNTQSSTTSPTISSPTSSSNSSTNDTSEYTLEEVAQHNTKQDCWMVIEGNVYDVTPFIQADKHPGKDAILAGCGIDATELFNTRPMGSGTPHSDNARANLKNYKIGILK